jgi:hypothetical protein
MKDIINISTRPDSLPLPFITQRPTQSHFALPKIATRRIRGNPLNLEDLGNDTGLPLSPACTCLLNILGIVGRNDIFACLGVVQHGLGVWEKSIEAPVEDTGCDKRVDVADVETANKLA